jgi:hypothetical protein
MQKVLLVFVDGVGLGDDAEHNPFMHARLPAIRDLLDGAIPLARSSTLHARRSSLLPLDATLGVEGTPQSGTGQTTLFTGQNGALLHGRHFGPWVPVALRPLLRRDSILARAADAGRSVAFANAYPESLIRAAGTEKPGLRLPSFMRAGPPVAAMGAGVFSRTAEDLKTGNAVASEIVNDGWRDHLGHTDLPEITAHDAGTTLARIAMQNDLTLFAHYATDAAGHSMDNATAVRALERVDEFVSGLMNALTDEVTLVIASDHGNIEDVRRGHTRNAALGLVAGRDHAVASSGCTTLLCVAPMIAKMLDVA